MKKFIIFSPSYNENVGGIVCLHKLCHIINELGREAYLYPAFENNEISINNIARPIAKVARDFFRKATPYRTNKSFNTPIANTRTDVTGDEWVTVYPEAVFGNPLGATNIVRWLLHTPGYHTGKVYYGRNEIYYKFNNGVKEFHYQNSRTSAIELKIIHYPLEYYNREDASNTRFGSAYCIRKGKGKPITHPLDDSILIDGKSHEEIAGIFKRVKRFYSYDTYTAYSIFAALCGCESIVIPDKDVLIDQWYSDPEDRYGISYGLENLDEALRTQHQVHQRIIAEHNASIDDAKRFIDEIDATPWPKQI